MIKIHAVGDIMLGEGPYFLDRGVRTAINKYGSEYLFKPIQAFLCDADIIFGNLEVPCSTIGENKGLRSRTFRGHNQGSKILKNAGFNLISVANNHFLTHGKKASHDTIKRLKRDNINSVGWGISAPLEEAAVWIGQVGSHKIGVIALCDVPTTLSDASKRIYFPSIYKPWVFDTISKLKSKTDLLILSIHWGAEYIDIPNPKYIMLARSWIDKGVDVILGHGPHVLQGYEFYNGKLIIYSMGNFMFDQIFCEPTRVGAIFTIMAKKGTISLQIQPVITENSFQVHPLTNFVCDSWIDKINNLSEKIRSKSLTELKEIESTYNDLAKKIYWKTQKIYLKHIFQNIHKLTIRSSASLFRDMFPRLLKLYRSLF
jgi:poly-gamma-glutamate synthesis protein (capsule biosynthesis protein)